MEKPPETHEEATDLRWSIWRYRLTVLILGIVALVILFSDLIFIKISPGERGVLWARFFGGTVLNEGYGEGLHLVFPWDKMYIYNIRLQKVEKDLRMLSVNGLVIKVKAATHFRPIPEQLPLLHKHIGPDYMEKLVGPKLTSSLRQVIGNFSPVDIYAQDEEGLLKNIRAIVRSELEAHYLKMIDVMLLHLSLPEQIKHAIEHKLVEEQRLLAYEYILQSAEQEKQRKEIESQGISIFEEKSGISILQWKGIEATESISKSPNSKVVIIGTNADDLPVILNTGP